MINSLSSVFNLILTFGRVAFIQTCNDLTSSIIAAELNIPVAEVATCILGQHGRNMVVIPRLSTVRGTPITKLLPQETIDRLVGRTINGGAEIIDLLKTGSAFYAPQPLLPR